MYPARRYAVKTDVAAMQDPGCDGRMKSREYDSFSSPRDNKYMKNIPADNASCGIHRDCLFCGWHFFGNGRKNNK